MEEGCLSHCDVPYAFKVCAFMEAYRLGYRYVLWLDALIEPLRTLEPIFEHIKKKGCLYRYSAFPFKDQVTKEILEDFKLQYKDVENYKHVAAGILGFNLSSPRVVELLKEWHAAVHRDKSFNSNFPEQLPLTILLHKYNMQNCSFGPNLLIFSDTGSSNYFFRCNYKKKDVDRHLFMEFVEDEQ